MPHHLLDNIKILSNITHLIQNTYKNDYIASKILSIGLNSIPSNCINNQSLSDDPDLSYLKNSAFSPTPDLVHPPENALKLPHYCDLLYLNKPEDLGKDVTKTALQALQTAPVLGLDTEFISSNFQISQTTTTATIQLSCLKFVLVIDAIMLTKDQIGEIMKSMERFF